jgi:hypothetical protein
VVHAGMSSPSFACEVDLTDVVEQLYGVLCELGHRMTLTLDAARHSRGERVVGLLGDPCTGSLLLSRAPPPRRSILGAVNDGVAGRGWARHGTGHSGGNGGAGGRWDRAECVGRRGGQAAWEDAGGDRPGWVETGGVRGSSGLRRKIRPGVGGTMTKRRGPCGVEAPEWRAVTLAAARRQSGAPALGGE